MNVPLKTTTNKTLLLNLRIYALLLPIEPKPWKNAKSWMTSNVKHATSSI